MKSAKYWWIVISAHIEFPGLNFWGDKLSHILKIDITIHSVNKISNLVAFISGLDMVRAVGWKALVLQLIKLEELGRSNKS